MALKVEPQTSYVGVRLKSRTNGGFAYEAQIRRLGKIYSLGSFGKALEAARVHDLGAQWQHFHDDVRRIRLNFPATSSSMCTNFIILTKDWMDFVFKLRALGRGRQQLLACFQRSVAPLAPRRRRRRPLPPRIVSGALPMPEAEAPTPNTLLADTLFALRLAPPDGHAHTPE